MRELEVVHIPPKSFVIRQIRELWEQASGYTSAKAARRHPNRTPIASPESNVAAYLCVFTNDHCVACAPGTSNNYTLVDKLEVQCMTKLTQRLLWCSLTGAVRQVHRRGSLFRMPDRKHASRALV